MSIWVSLLAYLLWKLVRVVMGEDAQVPSEGFVLAWAYVALGTALLALGAVAGIWWCWPALGLGAVLLAPWTVTRALLIPLGLPRLAYALSWCAGWRWNRDRAGGALVAGAWALLRQRRPAGATVAWLERRRDAAPALQAAQVLATGLLAAARGDLAGARRLLDSVDGLGPRRTPRYVHALAREWLALDAAERGDWAEVVACGEGPQARTRLTLLLAAVGACLMDETGPRPTRERLWVAWLLAPQRRHTWPLLQRALAASAATAGDADADRPRALLGTGLVSDPYLDALATHAAVIAGRSKLTPAQALRSAGDAWQRALDDPDTQAWIAQRAAHLGARSQTQAQARLRQTITRELAEFAQAHDLPVARWARDCGVLREVERVLREEQLSSLELAFDALANRVARQEALPPMDEWRAWLSLRAQHRQAAALGGLDLRRLAFPQIHQVACKWAVWMWNERKQYLLANSVFAWLLAEAVLVGDAEAIELQRRNWDDSL